MDSVSKKHNYSIESEELEEEETYVKDYTEAEIEQYLRLLFKDQLVVERPLRFLNLFLMLISRKNSTVIL